MPTPTEELIGRLLAAADEVPENRTAMSRQVEAINAGGDGRAAAIANLGRLTRLVFGLTVADPIRTYLTAMKHTRSDAAARSRGALEMAKKGDWLLPAITWVEAGLGDSMPAPLAARSTAGINGRTLIENARDLSDETAERLRICAGAIERRDELVKNGPKAIAVLGEAACVTLKLARRRANSSAPVPEVAEIWARGTLLIAGIGWVATRMGA